MAVPAVLVMAGGLSACFGSHTPLIGAKDSLQLFGAEGEAVRVMHDQLGGPTLERVRFRWRNGAYQISNATRPEPALYRLKQLDKDWYIWAMFQEGEASAYGLARLDGLRVWAYRPECAALNAALQRQLKLAIAADGTCWLASEEQLQQAMLASMQTKLHLIGYFELTAP